MNKRTHRERDAGLSLPVHPSVLSIAGLFLLSLDLPMLAGLRLLGHIDDRLAVHRFDILAVARRGLLILRNHALSAVGLLGGFFRFRTLIDVDLGPLHAHGWFLTTVGPELPSTPACRVWR
jgi:hypothetical protein